MTAGDANATDLIGRLLGGRYRVTSVIGRGGMGVVARAVDELLNREVAVKVLRAFTDASAAELADLRTRMQREAQAAARIRHSGVVTVHDVTEEQGLPVIVMELVEGGSLDDVLAERGALEPGEAAAIGAKLMDALDAAHRVGVLHRDVKPANVLLEHGGRSETGVPPAGGWGRVVLTDFGIATMETSGDDPMAKLTRSGEIIGSLDYLPPERAQGREPGPASDIWALGMTLYAAVEGAAPFRRTSAWSTLSAIVTEPLPEPLRAGPLAPVLQALMAKDPQDRPTAEQAREMLERVASGGTVSLAAPAPAPMPAPMSDPTAATPGFGPPLYPQQQPVQQTPSYGYPPQAVPPQSGPPPQAAAPGVAAAGFPAPVTSRTAARRARKSSGRPLLAAAAVVVLIAAGGGITYALTSGPDGTPTGNAQEAPPATDSPADTPWPSAGGDPSSLTSPDASSKPSASKAPDGEKDEEKEPDPTQKPGGAGDKPAETPSAPPTAEPTPTATKPTPVSTACTGWAHANRSDAFGTVASTTHLYSGPYAECGQKSEIKTGVKLYYHCYITNAYGNKWIYARAEGTSNEGWASASKLSNGTVNLPRC
ncbi:protein kinase [Streptomyces sp. HUAS MG47]|uniref:protein kinase domain-containing protein n=1 Tax=Streptomyces solicamelliae TaxID=3231716 RepID=UPI003877AB5D